MTAPGSPCNHRHAQDEPAAYPFPAEDGLILSEAYAAAQETDGLVRVQLPYGEPAWLVTRYADARLVLGDARFSRTLAAHNDVPRVTSANNTNGILAMDPPEHTRLRSLVTKAFTPRRVEALRPRIRELAVELVDDMVETGQPADLVERFALPLPTAVICDLLGVPVTDRPQIRELIDAWLSTSLLSSEEFEERREVLRDYMRGIIEAHRVAPSDDMTTGLIEAHDALPMLSESQLADLCVGILTSGHENTSSQIANFVYVLLDSREKWEQLLADPLLIPAAVEELTRLVPLVGAGSSFPRYAKEDVEVGGSLIRAGEPVVVALGAANRDPVQFDEPGVLEFARRKNRQHIGFGHGPHHCPGAGLSRLELQEALRALLTRLPGLVLAGDAVWKPQSVVRAPWALPVGW